MSSVRVYVTTYCGFCHAAKRFLDVMGVPYETIDVTTDHETRRWLVEQSGMRTVPQIFVGDTPIGGYDDMLRLDAEGGLRPLLDEVGVSYAS